ncbi:hypothetical protein [Tsukamurella paurometabola]|uniref:Uncharacterized protein n=1 Tax=Tsukamurella paurometabola TaxID=2061 RepID=A0A3P8MEG2_TSUPA|nr:hypothetical protein [Tsukamurella paurometabola]MBS4100138.1 hypothetical protein [Tsukamurella paurometabola]UEA83059.1 hypothetical protein LK411_22335 [Tsukamurella paurometabola]VDR40143.1 Uncharacterised protein [Tsukamurella paurometabola]
MTLHVDCSTCPAKPRACDDCAVGFLLGPVVVAAPPVGDPAEGAGQAPVTTEPGLSDAIAAFVSEGMLPHLRVVPDQAKRAG